MTGKKKIKTNKWKIKWFLVIFCSTHRSTPSPVIIREDTSSNRWAQILCRGSLNWTHTSPPRDQLTLQKRKGGVILKSQKAWETPGELDPPNQAGKIWAHRNWNVKYRIFTTSSTYISWLLCLCFWSRRSVGQVYLWLFCPLLGLFPSYWLVLIWELLPYHIVSCSVMFWYYLLEAYSSLKGNKGGMDLEDGECEEKLGKVD